MGIVVCAEVCFAVLEQRGDGATMVCERKGRCFGGEWPVLYVAGQCSGAPGAAAETHLAAQARSEPLFLPENWPKRAARPIPRWAQGRRAVSMAGRKSRRLVDYLSCKTASVVKLVEAVSAPHLVSASALTGGEKRPNRAGVERG